MQSFSSILEILEKSSNLDLSEIKKIYLLGSTGAGKTSLVRNILGTNKYEFPTSSQTKTTVTPTEYIVKKGLAFKTTIILKDKNEINDSIEFLVDEAIKKALDNSKLNKSNLDDIKYKLEESADGRFRLKYMVTEDILVEKAKDIENKIIPLIKTYDDNESLLDNIDVKTIKNNIIKDFFEEIEITFEKLNIANYKLFDEKPLIVHNITEKEDFIKRNKELLKSDFGSLILLVEYIRIEGEGLLADWLPSDLEFVLIDGEGIGHSLSEKRDTLSVRHYDFFDYCNQVLLVGKGLEPFIAGGQGAIESIYINGYKNKLKLIFSKMDEITNNDKNAFLRRQLSNLEDALEKQKITFDIENKDTYKLEKLNSLKGTSETSKKTIKKLFQDISDLEELDFQSLEYDFNNLFIELDTEKFILAFRKEIDSKHWMTIKAFSKRMTQKEIEFRDIKPISKFLDFIMRDINIFLQRDDQLKVEIASSQNKIKQEFSKKLILYIYNKLIIQNNHLWKQSYEKSGIGSHKSRKEFIFKNLFEDFLPSRNTKQFEIFKKEIKNLLLQSGAKESSSATKIILNSIDIKRIFKEKDFIWDMSEDINILIAKNGVGKSTILKLINACICDDKELIEEYNNPSINLTFSQYYTNDIENEKPTYLTIKNNKTSKNIKSVLIDTFDNKLNHSTNSKTELDCMISDLSEEFSNYHDLIDTNIKKESEEIIKKINEIDISKASIEELQEYQQLKIQENKIQDSKYKQILLFQKIINIFFNHTNKEIIIDDVLIQNPKVPFIIKFKDKNIDTPVDENEELEFISKLSSGEKQILIIFLNIVIQGNNPFILLMDEPESSLHVEWQAILIENIKKLNSNIQMIIATHNPIILLDRKASEIGKIDINNKEGIVQTNEKGTRYSDISSILLNHFGLSSLISSTMQKDIKEFTKLKLKEDSLSSDESIQLQELHKILDNSLVGDIIYNSKYFIFLKYLEKHKNINFEEFEVIDDNKMQDFLDDFEDFFND
jgi:energy-coupling factor transporter ATP-binding protein EcfA2